MVKKFNEFIKEGLVNKTLKRVRTGVGRIEDRDGLSEEEYAIYKLFSEWCKGGQLCLVDDIFKARHSFSGDWQEFQMNILNKLKEFGCPELHVKGQIALAIKDGHGVFIVKKHSYDRTPSNENLMIGFINNVQTTFNTNYYEENNVSVIKSRLFREGVVSTQLHDDEIYKAYIIPIKVFEKIMSQNKKSQNS